MFKRSLENPVLVPDSEHTWEAEAAFQPCPIKDKNAFHFVYRAMSRPIWHRGVERNVSTIGYAASRDGVHFMRRKQLIVPEEDWERFGCEDPRVTKLGGKFYIFYTALSEYPFRAEGIRVGVAVTRDFKTISEKHLVTPFNAKAMALFPKRIGGKIYGVLTVHTDRPPAHICLVSCDRIEELWSPKFWDAWYRSFEKHAIPFRRYPGDHLEVGAPPVETNAGWLFFFSSIQNYFNPQNSLFGIEAALLDRSDPSVVVAQSARPLLVPQEEYERYGAVPRIVFPSGAITKGKKTYLYYGTADTTGSLATEDTGRLVRELIAETEEPVRLVRFPGNPIIVPAPNHPWEAKATFNPGALSLGGKVHLLYRAMSHENTSVFGYAASSDGFHLDERLPEPAYVPREPFEQKLNPGGNSGCEDARLVSLGGTVYMCYTAYDGRNNPRVALSSISERDFLGRRWNLWAKPVLISPPGTDDKDAILFPEKIKGSFVFLHRLGQSIWIDFVKSLEFSENRWLAGDILFDPRHGAEDSRKIGIAGPPIPTPDGWLLLYHGVSRISDGHYHLRAALLDRKNPKRIIARTSRPLFEPETPYEREGIVPHVVFSNGAVVKDGTLLVYYGGADKVTGVATVRLEELMKTLIDSA